MNTKIVLWSMRRSSGRQRGFQRQRCYRLLPANSAHRPMT
jgi:hypothetical protein